MAQIIPIKDLKDTNAVAALCKELNEPVYVTKNGYGEMVVMSMETYEDLIHRLEMYRDLVLSEKQFSEGKMKEGSAMLNEVKMKYDL